ncbi:hypothetical protein ACIRN4_03760 [Pimelobacter simplex]|uniref:hypothetical protein n=1 Tax=Nocardioides simplex TaxID=2045 RepID=UPI003807E6BA
MLRWMIGAVCLALSGAFLVAAGPPAFAAVQSKNYSVFRCIQLSGVATFAQVTATGTISWTRYDYGNGVYMFKNVTVSKPTLSVSSRTGCGRSAGFTTRAKAEISQGFYTTRCGSNSGLSVGFPWGVTVQPTFSCNSTKVGSRSTSYGRNNIWIQNNTGAPVKWSKDMYAGGPNVPDPWPCIDMRISVTIYKGTGASDSVVWGNNEALHALTC